MPSVDQLKDKDKFNGSDEPDSITFPTFLGLLTARCVQQDVGHVLGDSDPNQRTRRLVDVMEDDHRGSSFGSGSSSRRGKLASSKSLPPMKDFVKRPNAVDLQYGMHGPGWHSGPSVILG